MLGVGDTKCGIYKPKLGIYTPRVMGRGTLVHSLGSKNLSPMIHYSLCHNSQNTAYSDIEIHDSFQYGERKLAEHKTSKVSTDEYGWHCIAP